MHKEYIQDFSGLITIYLASNVTSPGKKRDVTGTWLGIRLIEKQRKRWLLFERSYIFKRQPEKHKMKNMTQNSLF